MQNFFHRRLDQQQIRRDEYTAMCFFYDNHTASQHKLEESNFRDMLGWWIWTWPNYILYKLKATLISN